MSLCRSFLAGDSFSTREPRSLLRQSSPKTLCQSPARSPHTPPQRGDNRYLYSSPTTAGGHNVSPYSSHVQARSSLHTTSGETSDKRDHNTQLYYTSPMLPSNKGLSADVCSASDSSYSQALELSPVLPSSQSLYQKTSPKSHPLQASFDPILPEPKRQIQKLSHASDEDVVDVQYEMAAEKRDKESSLQDIEPEPTLPRNDLASAHSTPDREAVPLLVVPSIPHSTLDPMLLPYNQLMMM